MCATSQGQTVETGMSSFKKVFDKDASQAELLGHLDQLNNNPEVHGILVQLPLPDQMNANAVIDAINPAKDVDGFPYLECGPAGNGPGRHGSLHTIGLPHASA